LAALQRVHRLRGRHIAALRLELRARQGLRQWDEVLRLVRQLEKRGALLPELAREQRYRAHRENLRQRQHDAVALQAYRATIPAEEIGPRMTVVLADALLAAGLPDEAAAAIERQLAKDFDAELLQRYGRLPVPLSAEGSPDTAVLRQRLAVAERWLAADSQHSHEPELLVALGRLCLALRLWGKAQSYLEAALSLRDERGTHLELARLAEALGRQDEAERHYRQSARMS
jgi:HemY protein